MLDLFSATVKALDRKQSDKRTSCLSVYLKTYLAYYSQMCQRNNRKNARFAGDDFLKFYTALSSFLSQTLVCQVVDRALRCVFMLKCVRHILYTVYRIIYCQNIWNVFVKLRARILYQSEIILILILEW